MTIRLSSTIQAITIDPPGVSHRSYYLVFVGNQAVAYADTEAEAEQAKRAFENVLLPRFTRDEAIALVKAALDAYKPDIREQAATARAAGARVALEALDAARVFVDETDPIERKRAFGLVLLAVKCPVCKGTGQKVPGRDPLDATPCAQCGGTGSETTADKLDAAGIR